MGLGLKGEMLCRSACLRDEYCFSLREQPLGSIMETGLLDKVKYGITYPASPLSL